MNELKVFSAALQITDATRRSEYLDRECGSDVAVRQRIEVLLRNHADAGNFLEGPADPQIAELRAAHDPTHAETGEDEMAQRTLDFLQPSSKPGALGRLGHYEVQEVLGQGGFGTVVRAFDEKLHRMVAIKIMSSQLAATSPARKRFIREARSSAAIRHENIVNIHAIEEQPIPFLVMEYVAGETLQQRLDRTGPLDTAGVLRIGVGIAHGLAAAHAMGKIHRDIKPANILLENGIDRVKITDFGLARAADDASLTQSGVIAGTPLYMAPEQAQGLGVDHRADLFSLGSVLYVICSGRPPFRAPTTLAVLKRVAEDTPRPIHEIIPEVPEWLCDIITKLHAKRPEDRFQTAQEVAEVLGACLAELQLHGKVNHQSAVGSQQSANRKALAPDSKRPAPTTHLPPRPGGSKRFWLAAASVLLLSFVGLGLSEAIGVTTIHELFSPQKMVIESERKVAQHVPPTDGVVKKSKPEPKQKVIPRTFSANPDRRGAEFVVSIGGGVTIRSGSTEQGYWAEGDLPPGAFELKGVALAHNQNMADVGLVHLKDCRSIRAFSLRGTKVSDAGLVNLKDWRMLISLDLSRTNVGDAGLAHFQNHRFLTNLDLTATDVSDVGLAYLRNCKSLQTLNLGGSKVSDAGLAPFKDCKNLARVGLAGTSVGDTALVHLKDCQNLASLDLSQTRIGDAGLVHLKECKNLVYLDMANSQVSSAGLARLDGFSKPLWLNVKNTKVTDAGLKTFAAAMPGCMIEWDGGVIEPTLNTDPDRRAAEWLLANPKHALQVFANGTEIPAYRLSYLPKSAFKLRRLKVDDDQKVSPGTLIMLKGLRHLTHVEISILKTTDAAFAYLKDCKQLKELQVPGTAVTDVGVAQLVGFAELRYLNVKQTSVTEVALRKLAIALPMCKIEWNGGVLGPR